MIRRSTRLVLIALTVALLLPATAIAQEPPREMMVEEITSAHHSLDGIAVVFSGEVIGEDLGSHRDWKWLNVLEASSAVGVVVPTEWVERIDRFGDYHNNGTRVQVVGVLNIACEEHGGDLDVHADSLEVLERGSDREQEVVIGRLYWAIGLAAVALALAITYSRMKRRTL